MEEHDQHNAEFFILPYFSDQQKWIIRQRLAGLSYKAICEAWPFNEPANARERGFKKNDDNALFHQNIITCFKRSALGLKWSKGMSGGSNSYFLKNKNFPFFPL